MNDSFFKQSKPALTVDEQFLIACGNAHWGELELIADEIANSATRKCFDNMLSTATDKGPTVESLDRAIELLKERFPGNADQIFINPVNRESIFKEVSPSPPIANDLEFLGCNFFVVPDQKAAAWFISDPIIAAAYRRGVLTESDLERMAGSAKKTTEGNLNEIVS